MMTSRQWVLIALVGFLVGLVGVGPASSGPAAAWTPAAWVGDDTLELRTDVPGEGPYWFKVWLVVLDDGVYVRLGSRAAHRVEASSAAPWVGVRVGGAELDRVKLVAVPDRADDVAQAMAEKYWSDVLVRFFPHPITARLEPAAGPAE